MAYDEQLADRIRDLLAEEPDLTERKMFGGLAYLLAGHMVVAAIDAGGLMARFGAAAAEKPLAGQRAEPVVMRGSEMTGWIQVSAQHLRTQRQLESWVSPAVEFVRSLPPK